MAVALVVLGISRVFAPAAPPWPTWWPAVLFILVVVLCLSAYGSLKRYAGAATDILKPSAVVGAAK
jgi:hypothetical protein